MTKRSGKQTVAFAAIFVGLGMNIAHNWLAVLKGRQGLEFHRQVQAAEYRGPWGQVEVSREQLLAERECRRMYQTQANTLDRYFNNQSLLANLTGSAIAFTGFGLFFSAYRDARAAKAAGPTESEPVAASGRAGE